MLAVAALLVSLCTSALAVDKPETLGPMYEIVEPDMLREIQDRLKAMERSGELQKKISEARDRSIRSAEQPRPVAGLGAAKAARTYYYDPSVTATADIRDNTGRVIVAAGTRVNPFDYASMNEWLLFFDSSDPKQVALAERLGKEYAWRLKPILVNGAPLQLSRKWKRRVYFDQGGYLVSRLGILNVPALVTQEGKEMRIDELALP